MKSRVVRLRASSALVAASTFLAACSTAEPSWEIPMLDVPPFTVEDINAASMGRQLARDENCGRHGCPQTIPLDKVEVAFEITNTEKPGQFKVYYRNDENLDGPTLYARMWRLMQAFCDVEPATRDVVIVTSGPRPSFMEREFNCRRPPTSTQAN